MNAIGVLFNSPVFNDDGELAYIIHRVEDVSEFMRLKALEGDQQSQLLLPNAEKINAELFLKAQEIADSHRQLKEGNVELLRERRRAQEELRESQEWLSATLQSVGEAVIATEGRGHVRLMNRVAEDLTGHPVEQVLGRDIDEVIQLLDEHGTPLEQTPWKRVLRSQAGPQYGPLELVRKTGEHIPVSSSTALIRDERGAIIGAVVTLRDMTQQKRAEEQLQQINSELHQFVRSVSHDLREPLRMITLYSEMIQRRLGDSADDDLHEYLRYVIGGGERMAALLTDLRAYAEITTSTSTPPEPTDAGLVLQMALVNLTAAIEQCAAVIAHDPLPIVAVHQAHLLQLFQNLISNALKYRREEAPMIHIAAERLGEMWRFSCADNGAGIPPQHVERVFDFFQRFHRPDIPGTGMGLALCQRVVQRYGGRIWVDSTPGTGSTFHFTLPATSSTKIS
jgi:PAS domain S-box-containing protein